MRLTAIETADAQPAPANIADITIARLIGDATRAMRKPATNWA